MELFSAKGGTNIGAMIEAAKNTIGEEKVAEIMKKFPLSQKEAPTKKHVKNTGSEYLKIEEVV